MKEMIKFLENKIQRCIEYGDMEREKWAFIQALKKANKLSCQRNT